MRRKEKTVVKTMLDNEFALVVSIMRTWESVEKLLGPNKTYEIFREIDSVILQMIKDYPIEWRQKLQ